VALPGPSIRRRPCVNGLVPPRASLTSPRPDRLRSASQPCRQCTCPRADCPALRTPGRWTGPLLTIIGISARSEHFGHTVSRLVGLRLARPRPTATRTVRGNRLRWAACQASCARAST